MANIFEQLSDAPKFKAMSTTERNEFLAGYKQNVLYPSLDNANASQEQRAQIEQQVNDDFGRVASRSSWEHFRDGAMDATIGFAGRAALDTNEYLWQMTDYARTGVGNILDVMTIAPQKLLGASDVFSKLLGPDQEAVKERYQRYLEDRTKLIYHGDAADLHDFVEGGAVTGATIGWAKAAANLATGGAVSAAAQITPWATKGSAAASNAFGGAAMDVAIYTVTEKALRPAMDKLEMSPGAQQATTMAFMLLGPIAAHKWTTAKIDDWVGNVHLSGEIEGLSKRISSGGYTNTDKFLTQDELMLKYLTEPGGVGEKIYNRMRERGMIGDYEGGFQGLFAQAEGIDPNTINLGQPRTFNEQAVLTDMRAIYDVMDKLSHARAKRSGRISYDDVIGLSKTAEADELLNGPLVHRDEKGHVLSDFEIRRQRAMKQHEANKGTLDPNKVPVANNENNPLLPSGKSVSSLGKAKKGAPQKAAKEVLEPAFAEGNKYRWLARRDPKNPNKILVRAFGGKPSMEDTELLRKHGITWQPKKIFDPSNPTETGAFHGPLTEQSKAVIETLLKQKTKATTPFAASRNPQVHAILGTYGKQLTEAYNRALTSVANEPNRNLNAEHMWEVVKTFVGPLRKSKTTLNALAEMATDKQMRELYEAGDWQAYGLLETAKQVKAGSNNLQLRKSVAERFKRLSAPEQKKNLGFWKTTPGDGSGLLPNRTMRRTEIWASNPVIAQRFPRAAAALREFGEQSLEAGHTFEDVLTTTKKKYEQLPLWKELSKAELDEHFATLRELEDLVEDGWKAHPRVKRGVNTLYEDLNKLQKVGIVSSKNIRTFAKVLKRFVFTPDFGVKALSSDMVSRYAPISNLIGLSHASSFTHEVGHWAWYHVLSGDDRIAFAKLAHSKMVNAEYADIAWPGRAKAFEMNRADPYRSVFTDARWEKHYNSVPEMYADMFRSYINTHHVSDNETVGLIAPVVKKVRQLWRSLYNIEKNEIPKEFRQFVDRVLMAPEPRARMPLADASDLIQRSALYMSRETFMQTLESIVNDVNRPMQDAFLTEMLTTGESAIDAIRRGSLDIEGILNRFYTDTLAHHHLDVDNGKELDVVFERLARLFEEPNKEVVVEQLKMLDGKRVHSKYGIPTDASESAMPTVQDVSEARRQFAKAAQATQEHYTRGAVQHYQALKQLFNDIGALYTNAKIYKASYPRHGKRLAARMEQVRYGQDLWDTLNMQLAEESLERRGGELALDASGEVDDFAMRSASRFGDEEALKGSQDALDQHTISLDDLDNVDEGGTMYNAFDMFDKGDIPIMQLRFLPSVVSSSFGLEWDDPNGVQIPGTGLRIGWSPEKWLKSGWGPALMAHGMFYHPTKQRLMRYLPEAFSELKPEHQMFLKQKFNAVYRNRGLRKFLPGESLPKDIQQLLKEKRRDTNKIARQFYDLAEHLNNKFSIDEQRMIAELIERRGTLDVSHASPEVRIAAKNVNNLFEHVRRSLVTAGVSESVVARYGKDFLPEVYNAHLRTWLGKSIAGHRMANIYETLNAKFLIPAGRTDAIKHSSKEMSRLLADVRRSGKKLTAGMKIDEFLSDDGERILRLHDPKATALHTWEVMDIGGERSKLVMNRSYTKLERELLQEETSIVPRIAEFGRQASKLIAQAAMLKKLDGMSNLVFDEAKIAKAVGADEAGRAMGVYIANGFVEVPKTESVAGIKRFGALAGKMVDPEVMYALELSTGVAPSHPGLRWAFDQYKAGNSLWKIGKTAFNPTTHGINFVGNSMMCVLDGRNPLNVLWKGGQAIFQKGQMYKEAIEAGMLDSNILRSELELGDWMRSVEKLPNAHPTEGFASAATSWLQRVSRIGKRGVKQLLYWPMRTYELGDQVYKMGVFAEEMERGASSIDALQAANKLFFDYGDIPTGVKAIRDTGIMPFISYTYKLIPTMLDFAANNPHRLVAVAGMGEFIHELIMHQTFGDDWEDVHGWAENVMPDWMNRKIYGHHRAGIFGGLKKNKNGSEYIDYTDYSQILPGARPQDILQGMPYGVNPFVTLFNGLMTNKDPALERDIAPYPEATAPELTKRNTEARVKFMLRTFLPNLPVYPGSYSLERLGSALTASGAISPEIADKMGWTPNDYYGTPVDLRDELFGYMTGVRNRRLYAQTETIREIEKQEFGIKKAENEFERRLVDQRTSPSELSANKQQLQGVIFHNSDQIRRLAEVYRKARRVIDQQVRD